MSSGARCPGARSRCAAETQHVHVAGLRPQQLWSANPDLIQKRAGRIVAVAPGGVPATVTVPIDFKVDRRSAGGVFLVNQVDQPPALISTERAVRPAGVAGTGSDVQVLMEAVIDTNGRRADRCLSLCGRRRPHLRRFDPSTECLTIRSGTVSPCGSVKTVFRVIPRSSSTT